MESSKGVRNSASMLTQQLKMIVEHFMNIEQILPKFPGKVVHLSNGQDSDRNQCEP